MQKFLELMRANVNEFAEIISKEHGKIITDSLGDIQRGIEMIEHASNINTIFLGDSLENISKHVDCFSFRHPLGVCAGICAFNFPAMIPLWMFPLAIASGNTFILKPSERVASSANFMMNLLNESDLPGGVVNVVHGARPTVDQICTHKDIKTVSFVGGNAVGEYIWEKATKSGKRVQCNMGAKNHAVIMPDAEKEEVINALVAASMGSSGQRCMALTTAVFVGDSINWLDEVIAKCKALKVGPYTDSSVDLGPITQKSALDRIHRILDTVEKEGAEFALDGRNVKVPGYEKGNWLGPTIIKKLNTNMTAYKEEIFGPSLCVLTAESLDEAINIVNA